MTNYICINGKKIELTAEQIAQLKVIRKLKNQNKRNAQRKYRRMAKLVAGGRLPPEKFQASYGAWKNHISHGNCYHLSKETDRMVRKVINEHAIQHI